MADGSTMATFVIMFRETLEAALIVGIVLTVLSRLRAMRYGKYVWASTALAVGFSVLAGWGLSLATQATQGRWEKIIEGVISLTACGVLTYMVFWMDRQGRQIKPEVEVRTEAAVSRHDLFAMMALPFLAVLREGAETVLFLQAVALRSASPISFLGIFLGASLAVAVTSAIFIWGRRIPLKTLFRGTGVLLLLIGAGLLAYGIHELQELGWIPTLLYPVWDINHVLSDREGVGSFLKALFGYNGNPSLIEVSAYLAYVTVVLWALRRWRETPPAPPADTTKLPVSEQSASQQAPALAETP